MIIDLSASLNVAITRAHITGSHRVGHRDRVPIDILVKFVKFENKLHLMKARINLKTKKSGVYINEVLTETCVRLFALTRRLKRENSIMDKRNIREEIEW